MTQKGIGVAWGITSSGFTYTGLATAFAVSPTSENLSKSAKIIEVLSKVGGVAGLLIYDNRKELNLEVYPADMTATPYVSVAVAQAAVTPAVGDLFAITDADTDITGNWIVDEVSKLRKAETYVTFTVKLIQYATDISTPTDASPPA